MVQVQITDGKGSCETIECTEGHPFWVVGGIALEERPHAEDAVPLGAEPTAGGRWVEAGSLRAGDTLLKRDGGYAIVSVVIARHEQRVVYNLTLADVHTYAVGVDGVLVHNACKHTVYIVKNAADEVIYVGRTRQILRARELQHHRTPGRESWRLTPVKEGLSKREARYWEQWFFDHARDRGHPLENIHRPVDLRKMPGLRP